jgi:hypothetical protein
MHYFRVSSPFGSKHVSIVNTSCLPVFSFFSFWYCASLVFIVTQGREGRQIMKEKGGNGNTENSGCFFRSLIAGITNSVEIQRPAVEVYCALNMYRVKLFVLYTLLYKAFLSDILFCIKCFCPVYCAV